MKTSFTKIINQAIVTLLMAGAALAFVSAYAAVIFFVAAAVLRFKAKVGVKVFTILTWIATGYVAIALLLMLMLFNVFFLGWLTNSGGLLLFVSQLVFCAGLLVYMHSVRRQLSGLKFAHEANTDLYRSRYVVARNYMFAGLVVFIVGCGLTFYTSTDPVQQRVRDHAKASEAQ